MCSNSSRLIARPRSNSASQASDEAGERDALAWREPDRIGGGFAQFVGVAPQFGARVVQQDRDEFQDLHAGGGQGCGSVDVRVHACSFPDVWRAGGT
jgi:hypothetical protein